jgi:hypothetical protein
LAGFFTMNKLIIYSYTFPSIIVAAKHFRHLKVKVGQTAYKHNEDPELLVRKRISEQMGTSSAEDFVVLKHWVIEKTDSLYSDKHLHQRFLKSGVARTDGKGTEWFAFPRTKTKDVIQFIEYHLDNYYHLSWWQKIPTILGRAIRKIIGWF